MQLIDLYTHVRSRDKAFLTELLHQISKRFFYDSLENTDRDKYFPVDYIAAFLDPRTKTMEGIIPAHHVDFVANHILGLLLRGKGRSRTSGPVPISSPEKRNRDLLVRLGRASIDDLDKDPHEIEVQSYRALLPIAMTHDPLDWWRRHEPQYPSLAKLARV